ncbi:MAG TPA: undecaprenyl diphosphate synthase family protein [Candidatus Diapherotrites archaeon]|uniref:Undecaprenyl diphosphate synthase family protein n=1 Tax=Candidatus Iainarchaeum sp. TaxID=3101447 RepID=A0A7J4IVV5_9ARCH|nr:undecaprenyl diphosphate synthase family protein [Candidatus Diapherotrites archaeon]
MIRSIIRHVLIIPDGNRRWAKKNNKSLKETYKHALLAVTTKLIESILIENKVKILTIFIISRDNVLKRKAVELKPIIDNEILTFNEWMRNEKFRRAGIKFKFIWGNVKLPRKYIYSAKNLERSTDGNTGPTCNFLAGYDAESESKNAIKKIKNRKIKSLVPYLALNEPIDLIIRTGGEKRLSGAPLLQSAYAEIEFLKEYYPQIKTNMIKKMLLNFGKKDRRFGV